MFSNLLTLLYFLKNLRWRSWGSFFPEFIHNEWIHPEQFFYENSIIWSYLFFSCLAERLYNVNPHQVYSETGHPNVCTRHGASPFSPSGRPQATALHLMLILWAPLFPVPSFRSNALALFTSLGTKDSIKGSFSGISVDFRNYVILELHKCPFSHFSHKM